MSKVSVRERRAVQTYGELNIIISARQGWMPNPTINSVVSRISSEFSQLAIKNGSPVNAQRVFADIHWYETILNLSGVKSMSVTTSPDMEIAIRFKEPLVRNPRPGMCEEDYTAKFVCEWIPRHLL